MQSDLRAFFCSCFVLLAGNAMLLAQDSSVIDAQGSVASHEKEIGQVGVPPNEPFSLPPEFEAREVAGDDLVHDAFCMTLDAKGRPVVSGPGYVRTLLDDNQDGIFDRAIDWAKLPKQGAQGLWVEGSDLYWVGDGGVWKSKDSNNDLVGDGQPTKVLTVPTGGEHDSHAIRRGPDGYWYLIVGNFANGVGSMLNSPNSPIAKPRAGTVWRISPDFKTKTVWSHGLRNAYDFDFLPDGQIVTFDSDGERDITLPLYRPTRVMVLAPGSDAGWVGEAWKDDDHRVTMPRVLASLGRSSPTGVAVYRHFQFPSKYTDAVFVLDWTFGRVIALYPESVSVDAANPVQKKLRLGAETFMESVGTIGFAPTDICVEPSGGLYVSVGGRGTRGAIYQVRYVGNDSATPPTLFASEQTPVIETVSAKAESPNRYSEPWTAEKLDTLRDIVFAPCPLEAWSQAKWRPKVAELELSRIADTAANAFRHPDNKTELSVVARVGAFQKLLQFDRALAPALLDRLLKDTNPDIQALAWRTIAWEKVGMQPADMKRWQEWVDDTPLSDPSSRWSDLFGASALQARLECSGLRRWPVTESLRQAVETTPRATTRELRHAWLWAISRQQRSPSTTKKPYTPLDEAASTLLYGTVPTKVDTAMMDAVSKSSNARTIGKSVDQQLEAIHLILAALGDIRHHVAPQQNTPNPTIFDGYDAKYAMQLQETSRNGWATWTMSLAKNGWTSGQPEVHAEAIRLLATLHPSDPTIHQYCLSQIEEKSHPTSDIHVLIAVACCTGERTSEDTAATAKALLELQQKVRSRGLNTDNHWQPRLTQLFERLMKVDPALPNQMVNSPNFGSADHLLFAEKFPPASKGEAQRQIKLRLPQLPTKQWSPSLLKFANVTANDKDILASLRTAASEPTMRSTAIEILAKSPTAEDYDVFLDAIGGTDRTAWKAAWNGLNRLPILRATDELISLAIQCIRIEGTTSDPPSTALIGRMRQCCEKLSWTTPPKSNDSKTWCDYLKTQLDESSFAKIESVREPAGAWISKVDALAKWNGDPSRGKLLFAQAKCAQCHGGGSGLGPDLQGISKRFSRSDLFRAIFEPNRDISDRYRAMKVLTSDSNIVVGMKVYDSADGVTLQTADGSLVRINQDDIEQKGFATESLMPVGLLDGMSPQQLADLYIYMQSL